jgi:hypothetical protein
MRQRAVVEVLRGIPSTLTKACAVSRSFFIVPAINSGSCLFMKSMLIGALIIAVAVLGYFYRDSQHNTVVKVPGVTIKKD